MAGQLSRERILEMEEEMNRFEQEIAQPQSLPEPPSFPGSSAIQFIPHQLRHHILGPPQSETQPVFIRPPFPPQSMMGPMQMPIGPNATFVPPQVVGSSTFVGPTMPRGPLPAPPAPPISLMSRAGGAPLEPAVVVAAPSVYASPPVKLVTVYQEHKPEVMRPLPPPPPIPAALKPEVPEVVLPQQIIHKGVVGRPPDHSYEEPSTTSKKASKKKRIIRLAGSQIWEDNSLLDWDLDDFRIFCGDLGNDVTDEILTRAFGRYTSFVKAKVVRDKRTNKTKGYGFVSFKDPQDFIKAMREMNGKYVGSRPIKLRKSSWKDRNIEIVRKKQKEKEKLGLL